VIVPLGLAVVVSLFVSVMLLRWAFPHEAMGEASARRAANAKHDITLVLTDVEAWQELCMWNPTVRFHSMV
jgi:hypothetical protein